MLKQIIDGNQTIIIETRISYLRHFWYLQAAHCFLTEAVMGHSLSALHTGSSCLWVFLLKKALQE